MKRCFLLGIPLVVAPFVHSCARHEPLVIPAANVLGGTLSGGKLFAEVENGDFIQSAFAEWPSGWNRPGAAKAPPCAAETTSANDTGSNCKLGARCAKLQATGRAFPAPCFLSQLIDAKTYRGRRFTFRANVRAEVSAPSKAFILVRVHTGAARAPSRDPMTTTFFEHVPITSQRWGTYEIKGVVDADAHDIELGLQLRGEGDAWMDSASLKFSRTPKYPPLAALFAPSSYFAK